MSWLADAGTPWGSRIPVVAWIDSGSSEQIEFTIPVSWDAFWTWAAGHGGSPADELRVTKADGETSVGDIQVVSFTLATRTCVIRVTAQTVTSDTAHVLWLYWDKSGASAVSTTVASSSPKTGNLEDLEPVGGPVVDANQSPAGATALTDGRVVKSSVGVQVVWWCLENKLQKYATQHNGHTEFEEVESFYLEVYDSASDQTATMVDGAANRMVVVNGVVYLRTRWKAGTAGNDYNLRLTVTTSDGRTFQARKLGLVQDLTE